MILYAAEGPEIIRPYLTDVLGGDRAFHLLRRELLEAQFNDAHKLHRVHLSLSELSQLVRVESVHGITFSV